MTLADTPFIADQYDFLLMTLAAFVRFTFALKSKINEVGQKFEFKKYFDARHFVRWGSHLVAALTFLLFVPELYEHYIAPEYLEGFPHWNFTGDFIIGFLGYDLVKFVEKRISKITDKF